ncbi:hypothetical protein BRC91_02355 [Halobacteriales archaeon QS_4_62_28]|nr:MAG: hypothetical protein BRC91_02355 [Halobacteriales archaeon QS_4_62_28]
MGDRAVDASTADDQSALLGLSEFKENPGSIYNEPHKVTVTNQTDSQLTDNRVRSDINGGNGDLEFRDVGGSNSTTDKALGGLSPSESDTFEIVTAPDESGEVTDTVTLEYASPGDVSITVVRDITVEFKAAAQLVYAVDTDNQDGDIRVYDAVNDVLNKPPQSVQADVIGANAADILSGSDADIPFASKKNNNKDVHATWVNASSDKKLGKGEEPKLKKQKTRLALRPWPDSSLSGPLVLAADKDASQIVGIDSNGNTDIIASPPNGCDGVAGVRDIDGDSSLELVFVDSSQQIRYLEQDGTTTKVPDGGVGSDNSTGFGSPAVFPGSPDSDSDTPSNRPEIPYIDGSNNVALVTHDGTKTILKNGGAKKAAIAPIDVDGDGDLEFAFLGSSSGEIKYIDNIRGETDSTSPSNETKTLQVDGSSVKPLEKVGLNSGT